MVAREEWLALAERCEKATGADVEIDHAIARLTTSGKFRGFMIGACTSSVDGIIALIQRHGRMWAFWRHETGFKAAIEPTKEGAIYVDAETPALALCAAFCRAMAERSGNGA